MADARSDGARFLNPAVGLHCACLPVCLPSHAGYSRLRRVALQKQTGPACGGCRGTTLEIVSRVGASVPPLPLLASLAAVPLKAADESGPRTSRCIHCRCCNDCTATRLNARRGSSSSATMWTCKPAPHRGQVQLRLRVQSRVPRRRQGGKKRNGHARRCSCFLWLAAVLKGFRAACTQSLRRMEWSQLRKS